MTNTINFFYGHKILQELAQQLSEGLDREAYSQPINVVVGSHRSPKKLPPGFNVALQTEHYFDANGNRLWKRESLLRRVNMLLRFDVVLDLSIHNKSHYHLMPRKLKEKIHYGPHIFPSASVDFTPAENNSILFFGGMNHRRERILDELFKLGVRKLPNGLFSNQLRDEIAKCRGVINVHHINGIYTEWPRILTAYLAGKVVFSEPLSQMKRNRHYLSFSRMEHEEVDEKETFISFDKEIAANNCFSEWLEYVVE